MNRFDKYEYAVAIISSLIISAITSWYLLLRQGVFNAHTFNKASALVAIILIGIVLLIGPLSRIYASYSALLKYRKAWGRLAFLFGLTHAILSYFFLFPRDRFTPTNIPFLFGLAGVITLAVLFLFSFEKLIQLLDRRLWWHLQNIGVRLIGIFGVVHFALLKYKGWLSWLQQNETQELARAHLPPESLLLFIFVVFVLVVRLYDYLDRTRARLLVALTFVLFLVIIVGSFISIRSPATKQIELTWDTCTAISGSTVEATFPPTCVAPDGRRAVKPDEVSEDANPGENGKYYGSSTFSECKVNTDCKISGCNAEICQGAGDYEQNTYSICVVPSAPTPLELKLTCGCQSGFCQWK